ncbi:MAG: hypothetical protein RMY64_05555 [Nostoc sp. DedQUE08]|uniref:hypothetical protein n=1 Tax=Nostoc sp. DedQUE08 TaxID=3075393 RepID=UPI002AD3BE6B|nr:hypothetical protein [Nostoc sp. DedQUE08]MDZ8065095.1 hypothetical protein [Nostoc sp. DedQUE08]
MSNTPKKPDPNSSNTPDPNSSNTPDPNSSNTPNPNSSNTPDPNSSEQNNIIYHLFNSIFPNSPYFKFINNTFFAHFLSNHPFIANSLIFLIIFLTGGNLYQKLIINKISDSTYQNKICQETIKLIEEELETNNKSGTVTVSYKAFEDNKNVSLLPFICEYSIEDEKKNISKRDIYLRYTPVFSEYINEEYIKKSAGKKMEMNEVCKHSTIVVQMQKYAKDNSLFDKSKGDTIKPGRAEILTNKPHAYPVHRWVCHFSVSKKTKEVKPSLGGGNDYMIDLNLEPYCRIKASEDNNKFTVPHYRDYDNPYSFYCTNPFSSTDSE